MELAAEEVGPTKDTVLALLDFLVDPLLPSKCLPKDQLSQEDLVAKQVHAVVLLYNYYHRKQHPGLEFLEFISFCKLATVLKPTLLSYLSFMQSSDENDESELELDALDKDMSLTEKEVVNACDVSRSLDSLSDKPNIEGWPIAKVAVFLVDSKRENCFLFHSSITMGVWSVIEKDVILPGEEGVSKKKRVIKKTPKENQTMEDAVLQQAAYLAVKEACVCNLGDLRILESHTVYSTSKANTGVRLYIMRCTQLQQEENLVPISDVLASLQGPLVRKDLGSWLLTPVVEYFHLLPFADKVSDWLSRPWEDLENGTQHDEASENGDCHGSPLNGENSPSRAHDFGTIKNLDHRDVSHLNEKLPLNTSGSLGVSKDAGNRNNHQSEKEVIPNLSQHCEVAEAVRKGNGCQSKESTLRSTSLFVEPAKGEKNGSTNLKKELPCVSKHSEMAKAVEENNGFQQKDVRSEPVFVYKKRNRSQNSSFSDYRGTKKINASKEFSREEKKCLVNGSSSSMNVDGPFRDDRTDDQKQIIVVPEPGQLPVSAENIDTDPHRHIAGTVYSDQDEKQNCAIVSCDSNSEQLLKMQLTISSKDDLLSQTARKVLCRKREQLSQRIRMIADEVALCDRDLDIVLKGGGDSLAVKIDAVMECCNDLCKQSSATENKVGLNFEDPDLSSHGPCQELDRICNDNSWTLPTYNISTLEGDFQATVTIKEIDFECSSEGTLSSTPQDSRNSAAQHMLDRLQNMPSKYVPGEDI